MIDITTVDKIQELEFKPNVNKLQSDFAGLMHNFPFLHDLENVTLTNTTSENDWQASAGLAVDLDHSPRDYSVVIDALRGTYMEHLITRVFPGGYRWRLWNHPPHACLRPHRDTDYRIHIPIETHPASFIGLMQDSPADGAWATEANIEFFHMELGKAYILNTFKYAHGVFNFSEHSRWHMVGSFG